MTLLARVCAVRLAAALLVLCALCVEPVWAAGSAEDFFARGVRAVRQGDYDSGISSLEVAKQLAPGNSAVVLWLGLAHYQKGEYPQALSLWREYETLDPSTEEEEERDLRGRVRGYMATLQYDENVRRAREALAAEGGAGDPRTLAIAYFRNLGTPEFIGMEKGFMSLLVDDVKKVEELTVLERDQLQALYNEMRLGDEGLIDDATKARAGRMLGAGRVSTGSLTNQEPNTQEKVFLVDWLLLESATDQPLASDVYQEPMAQWINAQKKAALGILNGLGYDEARLKALGVFDRILTPQTKNLEALKAYSAGLDAKDKGLATADASSKKELLDRARGYLEVAKKLDPNFGLAEAELQSVPVEIVAPAVIGGALLSIAPSVLATSGAAVGIGATAAIAAAVGGGAAAGAVVATQTAGGGGGGEVAPPPEQPIVGCGNAVRDAGEECDGADLGGASCESLERGSGILACGAAGSAGECTFDTTRCSNPARCGNGGIDVGETCDGTNFGTATCLTQVGLDGPLVCTDACQIDTSQCGSLCGNGKLDPNEICDPGAPQTACTAQDQACVLCSCCGWEIVPERCGAGGAELFSLSIRVENDCVIPFGQSLEGVVLSAEAVGVGGCSSEPVTLPTLPPGGQLTPELQLPCIPQSNLRVTAQSANRGVKVREFSPSECGGGGGGPTSCGNGRLDPGEECDPQAPLGTCALDEVCSGCVCGKSGGCGNGVVDLDEECDGTNLGGLTCDDFGLGNGELLCLPSCRIDTSGCASTTCGDSEFDFEDEKCDPTAPPPNGCPGQFCSDSGGTACQLCCSPTIQASGCLPGFEPDEVTSFWQFSVGSCPITSLLTATATVESPCNAVPNCSTEVPGFSFGIGAPVTATATLVCDCSLPPILKVDVAQGGTVVHYDVPGDAACW